MPTTMASRSRLKSGRYLVQILSIYLFWSSRWVFSFFVAPPWRRNLKQTVGRNDLHNVFARLASSSAFAGKTSDSPLATTYNITDPLWTELVRRFQGDFDNYNQVLRDRERGLLPREGGGHENIHCTLLPLTQNTRLAAFYFDGTPSAIFRFRFYELRPHYDYTPTSEESVAAVDTVLYTLHPDLEIQLRKASENPLMWPGIFNSFREKENRTQLLPRCDVRWSWDRDPILHAYASDDAEDETQTGAHTGRGIHAVMVHGQALVESQMLPGQQILIKDQLSMWPDALWIHDRGLDPETGNFIYGNQRNVPYALDRVADFTHCHDNDEEDVGGKSQEQQSTSTFLLRRRVVHPDLAWTLGPYFRTSQEYEARIDAMGGPSAALRK